MAEPSPPSVSLHPIVRARWAIVAVFVALCAWLVPGVSALQHDDDVLAFLPPDHPDVVTFGDVADRFGMLEVGLVGLRNGGDDLLVPVTTESVRTLGVSVSELPGVRLVLSYPDLPDPRVEGETLVVEPLVPKGTSDAAQIRTRVLGNHNAVGNLVSVDGTAAVLLVYLLPTDDAAARAENLQGIRTLVEERWEGEAHFGGGPFAESTAALSSRDDIERLSPVVIGVLVLASALLLGSLSGAAINLVVTALGVGLVVGAHGRFGEPLTIVSSTTPVMMVALGGAFGMHIIAGFQRQTGTSVERASATVRELLVPVVLSGVTTATAFFALLAMPQVPMQRFGVVAGVGVLLLLLLALFVLPALLALLPSRALPTKLDRRRGMPFVPPPWVLAGLGVIGLALCATLAPDPDTRNVFDKDSEPGRADAFLAENFGGSQFVQVAIEGDLQEPAVLRSIRGITESLATMDGIAEVRSLLDPVSMLTEGFGGRYGVPSTPGRARRVVSNLADQAPMAQLMTPDQKGAIVHIKLEPASSEEMQATTARIRAVVDDARSGMVGGEVRVALASVPEVAAAQREVVRARVERLLGTPFDDASLTKLQAVDPADPALSKELAATRARALGTDEVIEPLEASEYESVPLKALATKRGKELEAVLHTHLPTLVASDPEGVTFAAEQLGQWVDELLERYRVTAACTSLGLEGANPPVADKQVDAMGFEVEDAPAPKPVGPCGELLTVLSELQDTEWTAPVDAPADAVVRSFPVSLAVTGQPVIGQAFAESVHESLGTSTLVSLGALALTLLLAGHIRALVPAVWTLAITGGVLALLGQPISIGTSMVSCIALGAGVDFAIHLGVRARSEGGDGQAAVDALGGVVLMTGVQLAAAFLVLMASGMPPLRDFGLGLAIGLLVAAAGAVWLTPRLFRR
ncbi:MAG: efflux RND transporter permease subunit [Nannocystales bacterium]